MTYPQGGRICVVMMSAIGDAVHVLPVINAIKRHDGAAHITWVLQPGPAELVRGHQAIDEILLFHRSTGLGGFFRTARDLRARDFDLVLNLQVYLKAGVVTRLSGAKRRLGFDKRRARDFNWLFTTERIPAHPVQHVQDQYLEFLHHLGIHPHPLVWDLGPWDHEREMQRDVVKKIGAPYVALVIGSSKPEKDWAAERWAAICDHVHDVYGLHPVLVGGRSRKELATEAAIVRRARVMPKSFLGSGLRRLVSILDAAECVISPDTGPLHVAVALNKPVISLMGYTDPRRTGPYSKFHDLIVDAFHRPGETGPITTRTRRGRMASIEVGHVVEKLALWHRQYRENARDPASR